MKQDSRPRTGSWACGFAACRTGALVLALVVMLVAPAPAQDVDPAVARLRDFYAVLLHTMKEASRMKLQSRYDALAPAVQATFDLPTMTRIAVGATWSSIPTAQQEQLIREFSRMTIANYAVNFDSYEGENFEVDPTAITRSANRFVKSRLTRPAHEAVPFNYLFHSTQEGWKAVDVYLNGTISQLATRRSEFSSILSAGGAAALIDSLKKRNDKLMQSS